MRLGKRALGFVAILAIALQTVLAAFACAPMAQAAPSDPTAIICHSVPASDSGDTGSTPGDATGCCDHCILCGATAASPPVVVAVLDVPRTVATVLSVPIAAGAPVPPSTAPPLARGPPQNA